MIISTKYKYIFTSTPKTGSQSIRDFLKENDKTAYWNSFVYKGKNHFANEHDRPRDIKRILGTDYNEFFVFAFIRDPFKIAISGYFFYRNGKALHKKQKRGFLTKLNIFLAKILPFSIWVILKPLKLNMEYITDEKGKVIVDYIGKTESIATDMEKIFNKLRLPFKGQDILKKNISTYSNNKKHFNNFTKKVFQIKYKKDIDFYKSLESGFVKK